MSVRFRNVLLAALAAFVLVPNVDAQQSKKKKQTTTQRAKAKTTKKKPARARSKQTESPIAPAPHFTTPRSATALSNDLSAFLGRIRNGSWGVMVTSLTRGDTLFTQHPGDAMRPASTLKLFTAAVALDRLGTQHQFSTDVLRDGQVSADGTLKGNLILRGDGDPGLSRRFIDGGPNAPMQLLAQQIASAGIKQVSGDIIGDATAFDDVKVPDGWQTRYLGAAYAARVSALSLDDNLVWVAISPGANGKGVVTLEPSSTIIPVINKVRTVSGSGENLRMRKFANGTIEVGGTIGSKASTKKYSYIVDDPALFSAGSLKAALIANGIQVTGDVRLAGTPKTAEKIASVKSPELARMVSAMNRESLNLYAELFFRDAARGLKGDTQGTVASGNHAIREFFGSFHADTTGIYHADGSGLSVNNRITARAMVQLLNHAHNVSWGPAFHASLPVAGESETLRKRMKGSPAQGNLHAKTGTTDDVVSLAGYVTAVNGELLSFAIIYNGKDRWIAKQSIDVIGETLANFAR